MVKYNDNTTKYASNVVSGKILACEWEIKSCKRHLDDLDKMDCPEFEYVFDVSRRDRIISWYTYCRHVRGAFANEPIILDEWQEFDLGCIFGWVHKITGVRRFTTAYIRVARGNAKSTLMSGIALYGLCADGCYPPDTGIDGIKFEFNPEVVCGAVDKEQAKIVWGDARQMAIRSPDINEFLKIQANSISHKIRGGDLKKLSKDTKNKDGGAPCIIIIDEYHAHPTSIVKDVTSSGKGKRAQCLEIIITTAGEDAQNKPCKIEDDTVKKILDQVLILDDYFGMIRELDKDDDVHNPEMWTKASPIIRNDNEYSKTIRNQIKSEHDLAYGSNDSSKVRQWLIKRANLWQEDSDDKYMSGHMDEWKERAVSKEEFIKLTSGKRCWNGGDMSKCIDLTATGFVFRLDDGRYAVCAHGFIPENAIARHRLTDRVPYDMWIKQGWCTRVRGGVMDDSYIKNYVKKQEKDNKWKIAELCYDPWGARQLMNDMEKDGYSAVEVRQGVATLSEPTKKFRDLVIQDKIIHDGSPLLTWCLSNAFEIKDNNQNIKLNKKHKNDSQRIDLIAAIINAMSRAILNEHVSLVYEERGMREL